MKRNIEETRFHPLEESDRRIELYEYARVQAHIGYLRATNGAYPFAFVVQPYPGLDGVLQIHTTETKMLHYWWQQMVNTQRWHRPPAARRGFRKITCHKTRSERRRPEYGIVLLILATILGPIMIYLG